MKLKPKRAEEDTFNRSHRST